MKIKNKKNYLLGILLGSFLIIGIINKVIGIEINTSPSNLHIISLHSLFLGNEDTNYAQMKVNTGESNLSILSGLIIGSDNIIEKTNIAGIGGGLGNTIKGENGAIGGGLDNTISSDGNFGIIAGGTNNKVENPSGIILGGKDNTSNGGIILGGENNNAGKNSLVLGSNSLGEEYSFSRNGSAGDYSANINTELGMLIGTLSPIDGVSLIVNGAIKLGNESNIAGSIFTDPEGYVKFYDGKFKHNLGNVHGTNLGCQFGTIMIEHGVTVEGYTGSYAKNCKKLLNITCENGKFYYNSEEVNIYPYCYKIS